MMKLESISKNLGGVQLGRILEFRLVKDDPAIEARAFLRHHPVFYTRPLIDWTTEPVMAVFPEAPGRYTLVVEWRAPAGAHGRDQLEFTVVTGHELSAAPVEVEIEPGLKIWVPSAWEGIVFSDTEKATVGLLKTIVEPGSVVYDLGANLGLYSCHLARLVGPAGHVYCVEANPICVQFLSINLALHGFDHAEILPVAVLDRGGLTPFTLNYGNSNIGLSAHSGFYNVKAGHEIQVPCMEFDRLVETYGLQPPQVIKIDVEGVEHLVIQGMRETLEKHRPALVMELHGKSCARATLEILDGFAYRYTDPGTLKELDGADAVCDRFGSSVFQLLARPSA